MDAQSLAEGRAPSTEQEAAAYAALLNAARDALDWIRRFQKHAPEEARFGGEERVARRLSAAVRLCSFEIRDCPQCDGGTVPGPTASPMERPALAPCPACEGRGTVRVFAYPKPSARRRG